MPSQGQVLLHQTYSAMPQIGAPLVDESGNIAIPWYRLLIRLWQDQGGSNISSQNTSFVTLIGGQPNVVTPGAPTTPVGGGPIVIDGPGGTVVPQALTTSPFTFVAPGGGFLVVSAGRVDIERGASGLILVTLNGGAVPMRLNDEVQVSWFSTTKPVVNWFPN